jgi:ATP-binding cassette subfamily B (MDR/TAP) protein 1
VLFAVSFTAGSFGFASSYFPEYAKARFAAAIIFKMLGEKSKIDSLSTEGMKPVRTSHHRAMMFQALTGQVKFASVKFAYPQRPGIPVLRGLKFNLTPGKTLALVGQSGCGKSTVVSLLERFYDPIDGTIVSQCNRVTRCFRNWTTPTCDSSIPFICDRTLP